MSEEFLMTYGIPLASAVFGWIARHYNLGGLAKTPTTPTTPSSAPSPPTVDQRLANLEAAINSILAALSKPQPAPAPANP